MLMGAKSTISAQLRQHLQAILSSPTPLMLLVPSLVPSPELCAALIAYTLCLFHAIDAQVTAVHELTSLADFGDGNLVVIRCARERLIQTWLEQVRSACYTVPSATSHKCCSHITFPPIFVRSDSSLSVRVSYRTGWW